MHSTLFRPCLRVARPGCVLFPFFFSSPCELRGRSISPVKLALSTMAAGPGSLASRAEQCHSRGFFFLSILIFERATERKQRADVLCNAKTGTGTGEWAMESECDNACVLHSSCVSTTNPHCWDAMSRKPSNGEQRLDMMCLKGVSGTPHAIKHSCDSPDAVEQPIVATCIPAGVTVVIRGTAWMGVHFGPIPVCRRPKGGIGPWSVAAVGPISHETRTSAVMASARD